MIARPKPYWIEWSFVVFLTLLCGILTWLQHRWTGEIAQAELARLRISLGEQSRLLCHAFDTELSESCSQLRPSRSEVDEMGRDVAYHQQFRGWLAGNPRPIFLRIAVAIPDPDRVNPQLLMLDKGSQQLAPTEWPAEWASFKEHMSRDRVYSFTPFCNSGGTLMEFYGVRQHSGSSNNDRMIFELDLDYVRNTWLPELVRTHLNPDGKTPTDVEIRTISSPATTIYAAREAAAGTGEKPVSARLNRLGRGPESTSAFSTEGRWVLEARHRPGALEAVVSASRRRNLAVAVALNLLILGAGVALVRHTRRSRDLAESQMSFVASVSHELRTPLTVIRGAAHNIQRGVVQEPAQIEQYSRLIDQNAERLGELIEQVLEFARVGKQQGRRSFRLLALAEVLHDAVATANPDAEAARCRIDVSVPPDLPPVSGDPAALRRVFQNLIGNAIKHGGDGGWIGIDAVHSNGTGPATVEVRVADRGPGIPPGEQARVFKPFFRGARAQEKQIRGSGLGLSLAREILEVHGGAISVKGNDAGGATFCVKLPVAADGK